MKKILVMDDEIGICEYVKNFFEERGFQVFTSLTVKNAVSLAKKENPHKTSEIRQTCEDSKK